MAASQFNGTKPLIKSRSRYCERILVTRLERERVVGKDTPIAKDMASLAGSRRAFRPRPRRGRTRGLSFVRHPLLRIRSRVLLSGAAQWGVVVARLSRVRQPWEPLDCGTMQSNSYFDVISALRRSSAASSDLPFCSRASAKPLAYN